MIKPIRKISKTRKLINILLILLIFGSLLSGCGHKATIPVNDNKSSINDISNSVQNKQESINYNNAQIQSFFMLHKDELVKKYGNDYKEMQIGPEGYYDGYYYKKLGLTFGYSSNLLERIECGDEIQIDGIKNRMSFKEIQQKLGKSKVNQDDSGDSFYWMEYEFDGYKVEIDATNEKGNDSKISISRYVNLMGLTESDIRDYFCMSEDNFLNSMSGKYYDFVNDAGQGQNEKGYYFEKLSSVFIFNGGMLETIEPRDGFYFKGVKMEPTFDSIESTLGEPTEQKTIDNEKSIKEISYKYNGFKIRCISSNDNSPFCKIFISKTDNSTTSASIDKD